MNSQAWKCYRCNLIFREKSHANIHEDISNHPAQKIEVLVA
jgi:hypothetical protein